MFCHLLYIFPVTFPVGNFQVGKRPGNRKLFPITLVMRQLDAIFCDVGNNTFLIFIMSFKVLVSFCLIFTQTNSNYSVPGTTSEIMICLWFAWVCLKVIQFDSEQVNQLLQIIRQYWHAQLQLPKRILFFLIEINNTVLLSTTPRCALDSPKLIHLITRRLYYLTNYLPFPPGPKRIFKRVQTYFSF